MRLQKVGLLGVVRFQSLWKVTGVGSAWRTELRVHSLVGWSTPIPRDQIKWNQNIEWDRAAEPAIEAGAVRWRGAARRVLTLVSFDAPLFGSVGLASGFAWEPAWPGAYLVTQLDA